MKHQIDCVGFKPLRKGTLIGFADITIRDRDIFNLSNSELDRWLADSGRLAAAQASPRRSHDDYKRPANAQRPGHIRRGPAPEAR